MKCFNNCALFFTICLLCNFRFDITYGLELSLRNSKATDSGESWQGRWFPPSPTKLMDDNPSVDNGENWQGRWFPQPPMKVVDDNPSVDNNGNWQGRWLPQSSTKLMDDNPSVDNGENWHGRWFPQSPTKLVDDNPSVEYHGGDKVDLFDHKNGIKMGIPSSDCDNGKINITIDWDGSPINNTCFEDKSEYLPNLDVHPILHSDHIPKEYSALHKCVDTPIFYEDTIPTYGTHRPLWPKYGEYLFLPRQRWIHNLKHEATVMLYHPCANRQEIQLLKKTVVGCLYKHIITPFTLLNPDRPFALVTWGNRLEMSKVNPQLVTEFIKSTALRGPQRISEDGQFEFGLVKHAQVVSDMEDHVLCPRF